MGNSNGEQKPRPQPFRANKFSSSMEVCFTLAIYLARISAVFVLLNVESFSDNDDCNNGEEYILSLLFIGHASE